MMTGVAIIGAGHWGPHLIRNFNDHLSSQMLWVVESDESRRKGISARFPSVGVTESIEDALTDIRVDAMVVATPTSTHAAFAEKALLAGKHVLVEKPITNSLEDALRLCDIAESSDLVLMVGHVFLFNQAVRVAKSYLDGGELGAVKYLSMTRTNLGPVRRDVNAAWDLASHDISIANYWLDEIPMSVSASGGSWLNRGIEDVVFATLTYPKGVLVHIEASWLHPRKRRMISVVGSDRMLTIDDMDLNEPLRVYDKGVIGADNDDLRDTFAGFRSQIREGEVRIPHVTEGEPLRAECEEFLSRVHGTRSSLSDGRAGAEVVAVLEAIDRSLKDGGKSVRVRL